MIAKIIRRIRQHGLANAWSVARSRSYERYREWQLGIDTAVPHDTDTRNFGNDNHPYCPMCYTSIQAALQAAEVVPGVSSWLDYGSGKGRVLCATATRPFRRVIGVEYCPELSAAAEENIRRAGGKMKCKDVSVVTADAAQFEVPEDVTHVMLFNPFSGRVLEQVEQRLIESLQRSPRPLNVFYMYPLEVQKNYFAAASWLQLQGELSTGFWSGVRYMHYTNVIREEETPRAEEELVRVQATGSDRSAQATGALAE